MAAKSAGKQRRWERAEVNLAVVYQFQDEILDDLAKKLSAGGMFIESGHPKPVGSTVELQFNIPGIDAPVQLRGRVASIQRGSGSQASGMGIEFLDVEDTLRAQMAEAVRTVRVIASDLH